MYIFTYSISTVKKNIQYHGSSPPKMPPPPIAAKPPQYAPSSNMYRPPQPNYRPPASSIPVLNPLQQELRQRLHSQQNGAQDEQLPLDQSDNDRTFDSMVERNYGESQDDDSLNIGDVYQGDGDSDSDCHDISLDITPVLGIHDMIRGAFHDRLSESDSRYVIV